MELSTTDEPNEETDSEKSVPPPKPTEDAPITASLVIIDQVAGKALRLIRVRMKTDH